MNAITGRQIVVPGMAYAPTNEQGVVFLFGRLAPTLGFCVEQVQVRCPDCTAIYRGRRVRIEFEYWASHYAVHRHPAKGADVIVCWENDWESRPRKYKHLEIIDLQTHAGALPRVFQVGCRTEFNLRELKSRRIEWNVQQNTQVGDLIIMYRATDDHAIHDAWEVVGPFKAYGKKNKEDMWPGLQAGMRRVAAFNRPVTFADLKRDPKTRNLGVVRGRFMGKREITDDWPLLCAKILQFNPKAKKALSRWIFD
jgi:hypothetical protein